MVEIAGTITGSATAVAGPPVWLPTTLNPTSVMTPKSKSAFMVDLRATRMDEFLAKPIEAAALWAAIERPVQGRPPAGGTPTSVEPGLLDVRAILRSCGDETSVLETLRVVFRRSLPAQMARVRAALAGGDLVRLREAAHHLVGTVGTFSPVTAGVASTLEDAAGGQESELCAGLVERLGALCDSLLEATRDALVRFVWSVPREQARH